MSNNESKVRNLNAKEINLEKVVVSCGFGKMSKEEEQEGLRLLTAITGQVPVVTLVRKSISNFNIRKGMKAGLKVTLRGEKAVRFIEKIIYAVWPNRSDLKALERNFNQRAFSFGLTSLHLFPEIDETNIRGINISLIFRNDIGLEENLKLLKIPLKG